VFLTIKSNFAAFMQITFFKYQGTGNDFVMLDNLTGQYDNISLDQIRFLCDRKLGIGADGLIKISSHPTLDFTVEYYNSDGSQSFCGNGARCSVAFAKTLGCLENTTIFEAIDGVHQAKISVDGRVHLEMLPVENVNGGFQDLQPTTDQESLLSSDVYVLDTGSPHYV